jgi:hypothetical protein
MAEVDPFHTLNQEYPPTHRDIYHDDSECDYGNEIKRDGNDVPGTGGRPRRERCEELRP